MRTYILLKLTNTVKTKNKILLLLLLLLDIHFRSKVSVQKIRMNFLLLFLTFLTTLN